MNSRQGITPTSGYLSGQCHYLRQPGQWPIVGLTLGFVLDWAGTNHDLIKKSALFILSPATNQLYLESKNYVRYISKKNTKFKKKLQQ